MPVSAHQNRRRPFHRRVAVALLALTLGAGIIAAPAGAVYTPSYGGYWGPWLGSQTGQAWCAQAWEQIVHAGPHAGRTGAYPGATQRIYMQARIERLVNGRYQIDTLLKWRWIDVAPGQHARFPQDAWDIRLDGTYRVGYDFRWYVGGRQVGYALTYHGSGEYLTNWPENRTVSYPAPGCTMDVS